MEEYSPLIPLQFIGKHPARDGKEVPHIFKGYIFAPPTYVSKVPLKLAQGAVVRWPELYEFADKDESSAAAEIDRLKAELALLKAGAAPARQRGKRGRKKTVETETNDDSGT